MQSIFAKVPYIVEKNEIILYYMSKQVFSAKGCSIVCLTFSIVSQTFSLVSQTFSIVSQTFSIVSQTFSLVSQTFSKSRNRWSIVGGGDQTLLLTQPVSPILKKYGRCTNFIRLIYYGHKNIILIWVTLSSFV